MLALTGAVTLVRAQSQASLGLTVEAPAGAGCPAERQLQAAVEARVGRPVFSSGAAPRRIEVSFMHTGAGSWTATLRLRAADATLSGARALEAQDDCQSLLEALTVVVSTLVGIPDERPASAPPPLRAASAPSDSGARQQAYPLQVGLGLALLGRADLGLLPGLGGGGGLATELTLGGWSFALSALLWPRVTLDLGAQARARLAAAAGRLQLCWRVLDAIGLCAGAEAGALQLRSSGLVEATTRLEPFLRTFLGLRAQLPLTRQLGLRLELEANVPLLRARFYLLDEDGQRRDSHTLSPGIGAGLGVYWSFFS